jgi:hypothetical protein
MAAGHLNLFLDEVKIVEQPLGGMGNVPRLINGLSRPIVGP